MFRLHSEFESSRKCSSILLQEASDREAEDKNVSDVLTDSQAGSVEDLSQDQSTNAKESGENVQDSSSLASPAQVLKVRVDDCANDWCRGKVRE